MKYLAKIIIIALSIGFLSCQKDIPIGARQCTRCDGTGIEFSNIPSFKCLACYGDGYIAGIVPSFDHGGYSYESQDYEDTDFDEENENYQPDQHSNSGYNVSFRSQTPHATTNSIKIRCETGSSHTKTLFKKGNKCYVKMGSGSEWRDFVEITNYSGHKFSYLGNQYTIE